MKKWETVPHRLRAISVTFKVDIMSSLSLLINLKKGVRAKTDDCYHSKNGLEVHCIYNSIEQMS